MLSELIGITKDATNKMPLYLCSPKKDYGLPYSLPCRGVVKNLPYFNNILIRLEPEEDAWRWNLKVPPYNCFIRLVRKDE